MSHCSTTATSTYVLGKYSKSYPNQRDLQGAPQASSEINVSEWQHFTNPTIRLVLDIKKREKELESVRLRIIWSMNSGDLSKDGTDQREVVFEDIDLLSLSYNPQRGPQRQQQPQGIPLKAVYRDTVVGIRYLHKRDTTTAPVYRRFQITFMSSSVVLEFIDSIRSVCPCKANPNITTRRDTTIDTGTAPNLSMGVRAPIIVHPARATFPQPLSRHASLAYAPQTQPDLPRTQISIISSQAPFSSPQISTSSTPRTEVRMNMPPPLNTEMINFQNPPAPAPGRPNVGLFVPAPEVGSETQMGRIPHQASSHVKHDSQGPQKQKSLPSSSPPASSASNNIPLHIIDTDPGVILSSLRESSALYNLPQSTLEKLIGDIIREDSFPRLMESVASMWKIKKYVGI